MLLFIKVYGFLIICLSCMTIISCSSESEDTYSDIEFVESDFDIEAWANEETSLSYASTIIFGGKRFLIPTPIGFNDCEGSFFKEIFFRLSLQPSFTDHKLYIPANDYLKVDDPVFMENWHKDMFVCWVRTMDSLSSVDYNDRLFNAAIFKFQTPSEKRDEIIEKVRDEGYASYARNSKALFDDLDIQPPLDDIVEDSIKFLPIHDRSSNHFSVVKLTKGYNEGELFTEVVVSTCLKLKKKMLNFYVMTNDISELDHAKDVMKGWVRETLVRNGSSYR